MKTFALTALIASALLATRTLAADRVEITFDHPEKFADIMAEYPDDGSHRAEMLQRLATEFAGTVSARLKDGYHLSLTFTEIDLAGDYRDGLHQGATRIRLVSEFYAPRLAFDFVLTDPAGKVAAQGHRDITDHAFLSNTSSSDRDAFKYEKQILRRWARTELNF